MLCFTSSFQPCKMSAAHCVTEQHTGEAFLGNPDEAGISDQPLQSVRQTQLNQHKYSSFRKQHCIEQHI